MLVIVCFVTFAFFVFSYSYLRLHDCQFQLPSKFFRILLLQLDIELCWALLLSSFGGSLQMRRVVPRVFISDVDTFVFTIVVLDFCSEAATVATHGSTHFNLK